MKPFAKVNINLKGTFHGEVIRGDGSREYYPNMGNKIVNQGLDALGGLKPGSFGAVNLNQFLRGGCAVGTGNTAPTATDTALLAPLAFTTTTNGAFDLVTVNSNVAPYSQTYSCVMQFGIGAVVGNIAEIGMLLGRSDSSYTAGGALFCRALIQVGGSPGTITLTSADQLIVTYQLQWIVVADMSGTINVTTDGVPVAVNWTARPCNMGSGSGSSLAQSYFTQIQNDVGSGAQAGFWWTNTAYVAVTTTGTTTGGANDSAANGTYTGGTYTRSINWHWSTGHTVTARTMCIIPITVFRFQVLFASPISLTTLQTMDLNVQVTWAAT